MGSLGLPEIAFIFIIALLIFGPKKLPELGRTLGRGMAEFRRATDELKRSINTELALEENPAPPAAADPPARGSRGDEVPRTGDRGGASRRGAGDDRAPVGRLPFQSRARRGSSWLQRSSGSSRSPAESPPGPDTPDG